MENELYHFGIKGMKWGVHRTPEQLGHRTGERKKKATSHPKLLERLLRKKAPSSPSEMSDSELKKRVDRLTLEKKYNELDDAVHPQKKSALKEVLGQAGKNLATRSLDKIVDRVVDKAFGKKFDIADYEQHDTRKMSPEELTTATKWYQNAIALQKARKTYKDPDGNFDIDDLASRDTHKMSPEELSKASKWFRNATELDNAKKSYEESRTSRQSTKSKSGSKKKSKEDDDPLDPWQWSSVDGAKISTKVRR